MSRAGFRSVYGPVPSRRLGRSLGIDLVPYKTCTYDCLYCQLGRTTSKTVQRKEYVPVRTMLMELERKLETDPSPDFIGIAGSGEPTLNSGIGRLIDGIKRMTDIRVAVLTNGSLLWSKEVREGLMGADLVLPSLDAGDAQAFQAVNRPHKEISFESMVDGLCEFVDVFPGEVWLEVFLLHEITGVPSEVEKMASIVRRIRPARVQLNTVSRPPAEKLALPVSADRMLEMRDMFPGSVEIVAEKAWNAPVPDTHSKKKEDVLAMLRRRPCTLADVANGLGIHRNEALKILEELAVKGKVNSAYEGENTYYTAGERNRE